MANKPSQRPAPRPRLADIAAQAGVSIATVSRVLDDHPAILPETKARVMALAIAAGYPLREATERQPRRARVRKPHRRDSVAVVMPVALPAGQRLANAFELTLLGGIGAAMRDVGLDFSVAAQAPYDDRSLRSFMAEHRYGGVILLGQSQFHNALNELASEARPFVVWGVQVPGQRYCSVGSDNFGGGAMAATHLADQGRSRIAFIGQAAAITTAQTRFSQLAMRAAGVRSALEARGLVADLQAIRPASTGLDAGRICVERLVEHGVAFDALVAGSDRVAIGAIAALRARGRRVPQDVAVVGYDDSDCATLCDPPLTTIRQDPLRAGQLLVNALLQRMEGQGAVSERLPTELMVRQSCGIGLAKKPERNVRRP